VRIVTMPAAELPAGLRDRVRAIEDEAWPREGPGTGHDPALRPLSMLMLVDDRVVAALAVLSKPLLHAGELYAASGLSTVVTAAADRRRGYGRRLVEAARERIRSDGADLGIFTCDPPLQGFYERAGWTALDGAVLVGGTPAAPCPSDRLGKVTMAAFFSERAAARAATFEHARIELYPGEIDRLW
jgi:GNAT superfamily N-acetyltransferase